MENKSVQILAELCQTASFLFQTAASILLSDSESPAEKQWQQLRGFIESLSNPPHEESEIKTRKRKVKDPNAPRRPMSAFLLFVRDERERIKQDNPEMSLMDMTKVLGQAWQGLEEPRKQHYIHEAEKLKEGYNATVGEYNRIKLQDRTDNGGDLKLERDSDLNEKRKQKEKDRERHKDKHKDKSKKRKHDHDSEGHHSGEKKDKEKKKKKKKDRHQKDREHRHD